MAYKEDEKNKAFEYIVENIRKGRALRNVLKDNLMPCPETFYKWLNEDEGKTKQYAHACEFRAEQIFEDILKISDNNTNDIITDENGERTNSDVIQRSRLMVDARKWYLSKLNPKKYGDKNTTVLEGGDKPIQTISLGSGVEPK